MTSNFPARKKKIGSALALFESNIQKNNTSASGGGSGIFLANLAGTLKSKSASKRFQANRSSLSRNLNEHHHSNEARPLMNSGIQYSNCRPSCFRGNSFDDDSVKADHVTNACITEPAPGIPEKPISVQLPSSRPNCFRGNSFDNDGVANESKEQSTGRGSCTGTSAEDSPEEPSNFQYSRCRPSCFRGNSFDVDDDKASVDNGVNDQLEDDSSSGDSSCSESSSDSTEIVPIAGSPGVVDLAERPSSPLGRTRQADGSGSDNEDDETTESETEESTSYSLEVSIHYVEEEASTSDETSSYSKEKVDELLDSLNLNHEESSRHLSEYADSDSESYDCSSCESEGDDANATDGTTTHIVGDAKDDKKITTSAVEEIKVVTRNNGKALDQEEEVSNGGSESSPSNGNSGSSRSDADVAAKVEKVGIYEMSCVPETLQPVTAPIKSDFEDSISNYEEQRRAMLARNRRNDPVAPLSPVRLKDRMKAFSFNNNNNSPSVAGAKQGFQSPNATKQIISKHHDTFSSPVSVLMDHNFGGTATSAAADHSSDGVCCKAPL